MQFVTKTDPIDKQRSACLVVGVCESRRLSPSAKRLDDLSEGLISGLAKRGDISGKLGQTLLLHDVPAIVADRVLLVGCGRERNLDANRFRRIIAKAFSTVQSTGATEAVSYLGELAVQSRDLYWKIRQSVELAESTGYRVGKLKTKKRPGRPKLRRIGLAIAEQQDLAEARRGIRDGKAIAAGVELAKNLANLPANICTPTYLADQARELAKEYDSIKVSVLDEARMKRLGMGALLAVAQGSREPAKLIVLEYKPQKQGQKPIVFVGKGVTFDSGGISIKPSAAMDEMKFDMSGAASVLGLLRTVAALKLPQKVIGIVPATENLPDGLAIKPGDVVTSLSGQTIEILNTDAEGRLILCDALTYAERYEPKAVIDIATLTGACVIALGKHATGLFSNNDELAGKLLNAGITASDRAWQMPVWDDYQEQLDTRFADMANVGGREAGSITAACFLSRFTGKYHWAHLDIAGTAWLTGKSKGATGRPVPLLAQYLLDLSDDAG